MIKETNSFFMMANDERKHSGMTNLLSTRRLSRRAFCSSSIGIYTMLSGLTACASDQPETSQTYPIGGGLLALWSPDGKRIAAPYDQGAIALWSTESTQVDEPLLVYRHHHDFIWGLAWSPDSRQLASISADGLFTIWDAQQGNTVFSSHLPETTSISTTKVAWSSNGANIAVSLSEQMMIWSAESMQNAPATITPPSRDGFYDFFWSPDNQRLGIIGLEKISIWQVNNLSQPVETLDNPDKTILPGPVWSPDWQKIALPRPFQQIEIWSADLKHLLATLNKEKAEDVLQKMVWSPDSTHLGATLSLSEARPEALVWNTEHDQSGPVARYNMHRHKRNTGDVYHLSWSPDSKQIVSTGVDNKAHIWRVR